jgi:outer membrane protein
MELENNELSNQMEETPIVDVNHDLEKDPINPVLEKESTPKRCPIRPSTALNLLLLIAVAVLYFLHFYHPSTGAGANATAGNGTLKVAFFNTDSVFQYYELVTQLRDELKKEKESLEGTFNAKQAAFEQKVKNYQTNLNNNVITPLQAKNAEAQLMKEREDIMKMNEEFTQQLVAKEADINKRITEDIINYANKYNEKYGADYILGYTKGGPIIVTNPKLDVTKEITEGLNKAYKENKGK